ncbi:response regulator transcription factor [Enterococcus nangangensis]|uniref:response regulator transcription factor n=1 Tax=Enterococcus nangangensis TaxID=2559926 RepID=UPI0010F4721E|nr:response regulator transcription factor [Enterococcus nangangensis]
MDILIVEDDLKIAQQIQQHLTRYDYHGVICEDFQNVLDLFCAQPFQLVLLDVNLPYFDGFYWCQKIRQVSQVPLIFLSSRDHPLDQVLAIESGADDYLTKPFAPEVLLAKIKGLLRRTYGEYQAFAKERQLQLGPLSYQPEQLLVACHGQEILVTKREGDLLELFLSKYPQVISREEILLSLWDDEQFVDDNTLSVNITRLRKRLQELAAPLTIQVVRKLGYRLLLEESA